MKIKVIGSGDMWTINNSASYLIDNKLLIDIPNGTCKELKRNKINPMNIDHVLITHLHGDHYFDIPFYLLNKTYLKNRRQTNIYTTKSGKRKIIKLFFLAFPNSYINLINKTKLNFVTKQKFNIENYNIKKVKVDHGILHDAYGYIIEQENIKIGFTGDARISKKIEYMASICDYLFCDCTRIKGNKRHMGFDNIIYLRNKYPNCKFYTSHMNDKTRKYIKENRENNIIVLEDYKTYNLKK